MFKAKLFLVFTAIALLSLLIVGPVTTAQVNDQPGMLDFTGLTLEDVERLFPMTPEAEAAIVQPTPLIPVTIDGVLYEPEGVHLFDGQRLYFYVGQDKALYAFTTAKGAMAFQEAQQAYQRQPDSILGGTSYFYEDWWYGGQSMYVGPGGVAGYLGALDNAISSMKTRVAWTHLYDEPNFGGSSMAFGPDDWWTIYGVGWNDKASSIWCEDS
jgi:hypothetical protein